MKRILLVDDDRQTTSFLDRFLTKQGFLVTTVGSDTSYPNELDGLGRTWQTLLHWC